MNLKQRARTVKIYLPALFLAMKRKDTPLLAKIVAGLAVGYALSPIDLIPDFVPVLGFLDDLILLPLLVALAIRLIPAPVLEECKMKAEGLWAGGKPQKWYLAIPVVLAWLLLLAIIALAIVQSV